MSFSDYREGERDFERRGFRGPDRERYHEDYDYRRGFDSAQENQREEEAREERNRERQAEEARSARLRDIEAEQRYYHQTQEAEEEPTPPQEIDPLVDAVEKAHQQFTEDNLGAG